MIVDLWPLSNWNFKLKTPDFKWNRWYPKISKVNFEFHSILDYYIYIWWKEELILFHLIFQNLTRWWKVHLYMSQLYESHQIISDPCSATLILLTNWVSLSIIFWVLSSAIYYSCLQHFNVFPGDLYLVIWVLFIQPWKDFLPERRDIIFINFCPNKWFKRKI